MYSKEKVETEAAQVKPNSKNIIEQMVDGIVGTGSDNPTEKEKEMRRHLSRRAQEFLMFMDDDKETNI